MLGFYLSLLLSAFFVVDGTTNQLYNPPDLTSANGALNVDFTVAPYTKVSTLFYTSNAFSSNSTHLEN